MTDNPNGDDVQDTASGRRVLNKRRDGVPNGAVYVGRPSKWGNPFKVDQDGTREEVVAEYRCWLEDNPGLKSDGS